MHTELFLPPPQCLVRQQVYFFDAVITHGKAPHGPAFTVHHDKTAGSVSMGVKGIRVPDIEGEMIPRIRIHLLNGNTVEPFRSLPIAFVLLGTGKAGIIADSIRFKQFKTLPLVHPQLQRTGEFKNTNKYRLPSKEAVPVEILLDVLRGSGQDSIQPRRCRWTAPGKGGENGAQNSQETQNEQSVTDWPVTLGQVHVFSGRMAAVFRYWISVIGNRHPIFVRFFRNRLLNPVIGHVLLTPPLQDIQLLNRLFVGEAWH